MTRGLSTLLQDLRFAFRQLKRSPGFAITATLTIALGIGANTAIFTLANAVLLRKLPVTDPKSLYRVGDGNDCCISGGMPAGQKYSLFSTEQYKYIRDNTPEFEQLAAMPAGNVGPSIARRGNGAPRKLQTAFVSGNYFSLFQLRPERGRFFTAADDLPGAPPVAVMSYRTWAGEFDSDPTVLGGTFYLDSRPVTVVGIAPPSFYGDRVAENPPNFFVPISAETQLTDTPVSTNKGLRWLYMIGRVKPGVNLPTLQEKLSSELRSWLAVNGREYQTEEGKRDLPKVRIVPTPAATGIEQLQSQVRGGIEILLAISGLVLLIACANIANLLLARGMRRRAETSVRIALGAARRRILRQTLTESILLAVIGASAGVLVAFAGTRAMLTLAFPEARNLPVQATPTPVVLLFTLGLALLTGVLFGLIPAIAATRSEPAEALRGLSRSSRGRTSLSQRGLVVLQATLSLVLIAVAALLTRSLRNLENQQLGLATEDRTIVHLDPTASGYTPARMPGLMQALSNRVQALPGTKEVAFANYSPLEGDNWGTGIFVAGRPDPGLHDDIYASLDRVSPGLFSSVGQHVIRGRDFSLSDRADTPQVVVVNEAFVRKFFPHEDPLGKHLGTEAHQFYFEVVGVVSDAKYSDMEAPAQPMLFRSMLQTNPKADAKDIGEVVSAAPHAMVIHTANATAASEVQLRQAIAEVDSNLAVRDVRSFRSQIAGQLNDSRMVARITAAYGLLALALAAVGLYGVTAYSVEQRVPEIGLRMALGANRSRVLTLVLRSAMAEVLLGLSIGVPLALVAGHLLDTRLFGLRGHDPLTLFLAGAALLLSGLLASALPARRASAIEPMQALRSE